MRLQMSGDTCNWFELNTEEPTRQGSMTTSSSSRILGEAQKLPQPVKVDPCNIPTTPDSVYFFFIIGSRVHVFEYPTIGVSTPGFLKSRVIKFRMTMLRLSADWSNSNPEEWPSAEMMVVLDFDWTAASWPRHGLISTERPLT
jgi:hypothetical protein